MAWADRIRQRAGRLALLAFLLVPASHSLAGACDPARADSARLDRQIAANISLANQHGCAGAGGGFACREIAGRISNARAALAAMPAVCRPVATVSRPDAKPKRAVVSSRTAKPRPAVAGAATLCVRLSDGYYFPTPNSGFRDKAVSSEALAAQCRFICGDDGMEVFRRNETTGLPQDMVSLATGRRYADLPHAGLYRQAASARICDMGRVYRSATDTQAQTVPVPTIVAALVGKSAPDLFTEVNLRGTNTDIPQPPRKVRMVGPAFLPAE